MTVESSAVAAGARVRVFISAKSSDYEYAAQVHRGLRDAGVTVFFSRESLPELGIADYRREIDRALDEADHLIVVTSSAAHAQAPWVEAEWGFFINEKRSGRKRGNLVTVIVGALKPADLPPSLRYYEVIPFDAHSLDRILRYVRTVRGLVAPAREEPIDDDTPLDSAKCGPIAGTPFSQLPSTLLLPAPPWSRGSEPAENSSAPELAVQAALKRVSTWSGGDSSVHVSWDEPAWNDLRHATGERVEAAIHQLLETVKDLQSSPETRLKAVALLCFAIRLPEFQRSAEQIASVFKDHALITGRTVGLDAFHHKVETCARAAKAIAASPMSPQLKFTTLTSVLPGCDCGSIILSLLPGIVPASDRAQCATLIADALLHGSPKLAVAAALGALAALGQESSVDSCRRLVRDGDLDIAGQTANLLGTWRERSASADIQAAIETWRHVDDQRVADLAVSLVAIDGHASEGGLADLLANAKPAVQQALLERQVLLGSPVFVQAIRTLATSAISSDVQSAARAALLAVGGGASSHESNPAAGVANRLTSVFARIKVTDRVANGVDADAAWGELRASLEGGSNLASVVEAVSDIATQDQGTIQQRIRALALLKPALAATEAKPALERVLGAVETNCLGDVKLAFQATQLLADAQEPRRVKFERMLRCVAVALPGQAGTFLWALKNAAPASDRDRAAGAVLVKLTTMSSTDIDFKSALHTLRELGSRSVLRGLRERLRGATTANEATALARELAFWKDGDAIEDLRRAVDDWQGAGHDFELLTYVYQLEGVAAGPFLAECFHRATAQEQRSILRSLLEQKTVIAAKEFMSEVQILQGLPDDDETGISARDYLRLGASS